MNIAIIGAGASGIICALKIKDKNPNYNVYLIDQNPIVGKKILVTGNGRCNYWNDSISIDKYNRDDIDYIINDNNIESTYSFLSNLGIYPRIKDNLYYPYNNEAKSIREILEKRLNDYNINLILNTNINSIDRVYNKFKLNNINTMFDKLIISVGGLSYPKTGSDGSLYDSIKKLGFSFNKLRPSLTKLKIKDNITKCSGLRVNSEITLIINNKEVKSESGELQITDDSLSGICIFNLSKLATRNIDNSYLSINFINDLPILEMLKYRDKYTILDSLDTILDSKLVNTIIDSKILLKHFNELNDEEIDYLIDRLTNYKVKVLGTGDFNNSQVTSGGIELNDLNKNLESKNIPNLYFVGEILDIDGICGGFNLASSFITGYIVGNNL